MNGTACHAALEWFVQAMLRDSNIPDLAYLKLAYENVYWTLMPDGSFLDDGRMMLTNWYERQNWTGRTVVCTETKETFDLTTPDGVVPVTYIWDRGDSLDDGRTIEVTDYKTVQAYVSPAELNNRVQAKLYALAAKLKFPNAERIVFTLDLLRHQPVSRTFTTEELREFYIYLRRMYARMLADDGSKETINSNCGYCVRRHACDALKSHVDAGGIMGLTDPVVLADRRRVIADHAKALGILKSDLDDRIITHCQEQDILDYATTDTLVQITSKGTTSIDQDRVAAIIGDTEAKDLGYPKITAAKLKKYLDKATHLDLATKSLLRQTIKKTYGEPYVKTTQVSPSNK